MKQLNPAAVATVTAVDKELERLPNRLLDVRYSLRFSTRTRRVAGLRAALADLERVGRVLAASTTALRRLLDPVRDFPLPPRTTDEAAVISLPSPLVGEGRGEGALASPRFVSTMASHQAVVEAFQ